MAKPKNRGGVDRERRKRQATSRGPRPRTTSASNDAWGRSRHGAQAARGFHYQDMVGAWLAARVLAGDLRLTHITPEGLEDLSCEGDDGAELQAKSRQQRIGPFTPSDVTDFIIEGWSKAVTYQTTHKPWVLVLERQIRGCPIAVPSPGTSLSAGSAPRDLTERLRSKWEAIGAPAPIDDMLTRTSLYVCDQEWLELQTADLLARAFTTPRAATIPMATALRTLVAQFTDRNADPGLPEPHRITVAECRSSVESIRELIDHEFLADAINRRICERVSFDEPLDPPDFYSGHPVVAGHVAAGLVMPRPRESASICNLLQAGRHVLISGPSGVGKSALLWSTAYLARNVMWYRIRRLESDDVASITRFAKAAMPTSACPLGLIIDGVGTGSLNAFDEMREELALVPNVRVLATVREEDLFPLRTAHECAVHRTYLDDQLAELIHRELRARHLTSAEHWLESYEAARGNTLEYTYLLTQGDRLQSLISSQIRQRVLESRDLELALVSAVALADVCGVALPNAAVDQVAPGSPAQVALAVARLKQEHLVVEDAGYIRGLHPLRSQAVIEAMRELPPFRVGVTAASLLPVISVDDVGNLIARVLERFPAATPEVVSAAVTLASQSGTAEATVLAQVLSGLRIADFIAQAAPWIECLNAAAVPPALQPVTVQLALVDSDLPEALDPRVVEAATRIRALRSNSPGTLRSEFIARLGTSQIGHVVSECASPESATQILTALSGSSLPLEISSPSPLMEALGVCPVADAAVLLAEARAVSNTFADDLAIALGGDSALLARLQDHYWNLLTLQVALVDGERVLQGTLQFISDRCWPSPDESVKEIAKVGLRLLSGVARADLHTVFGTGSPYGFGDHEQGTTGLLREYARTTQDVAWNQIRLRYLLSKLTAATRTGRLSFAASVLDRTSRLMSEFVECWCRAQITQPHLDRLNHLRKGLLEDIDSMRPDPIAQALSTAGAALPGHDALHSAVQGLVVNALPRLNDPDADRMQLSSFLASTIARQLRVARLEPWWLVGMDGAPSALDELETLTFELAAVLAAVHQGVVTRKVLAAVSGSAPRGGVLPLAARLAEREQRDNYARNKQLLLERLTAQGFSVSLASRPRTGDDGPWYPREDTVVMVDVLGTLDVPPVAAAVLRELPNLSLPFASATLLPLLNGVLLRYSAVRLTESGSAFPLLDDLDGWSKYLDLPISGSRTVTLAEQGLIALVELSGLSRLGPELDGVAEEVALASSDALRTAISELLSIPDDESAVFLAERLTEAIDDLVAEGNGEREPGAFADGYLRSIMRAGLSPWNDWLALCEEWSIDPEAAERTAKRGYAPVDEAL